MNSLLLLIVLKTITISIALNGSSIDGYVSPSIRSYCNEIQEKFEFKYSFRARKQKNVNSHAVYLFTEDKVFSIWQMTAALNTKESDKYVIPEIFFNDIEVRDLTQFWDGKNPNDNYNTVFSDPNEFELSFWLFGDKYRSVKIDVKGIKVIEVNDPMDSSQSNYGFMRNQKIIEKGLENIFGVDIADTPGYRPIRVFVRDVDDEGNAISFAFSNSSQTVEEFEDGKHYNYTFDSAAFLVHATSLASKPKAEQYVNYFELRTRNGTFSLFDFTYNRDFLLVGTNEELMGCPPSFCHSREFDDIIRLHDGTKLLVFHEWVWPFDKPGQRIEWNRAKISKLCSRKHISKSGNFPDPFVFGIRHIVDGSFTDESILYIFRNGSFISSNDDSILENRTAFPDFTPIDQFFKGVPSQTYDAIFYNKDTRGVFFIKDDMFWEFSMETKALASAKSPENTQILGLPYNFTVKSVYVEEDDSGKQIEFYFFTQNHYIVFRENEYKKNRFTKKVNPTYYCTSVNFFGCADQQFECPPLETTQTENNYYDYEQEPKTTPQQEFPSESSLPETFPPEIFPSEASPPKPFPSEPSSSEMDVPWISPSGNPPEHQDDEPNLWIYVIIVVIIIIVCIGSLAFIIFGVIRPKKSANKNEQGAQKLKTLPKTKEDEDIDTAVSDTTRSSI